MNYQKAIARFIPVVILIPVIFATPHLSAWQPSLNQKPYNGYPAPYQGMPYNPYAPYTQQVNYRRYPAYPGYYPMMPPSRPMYAPIYRPMYQPIPQQPSPLNTTKLFPQTQGIQRIKPVITKPEKQQIIKPSENKTNKTEFTNQLLPYIHQENSRLTQLRKRLLNTLNDLNKGKTLNTKTSQWLNNLVKKYRVTDNPVSSEKARIDLLKKVDIIPVSLALAQAANESAWGKSRFATQANNLFGIWTYDKSKGLKPLNREPGQKHLVRKFEHFGESVAYYMHTLNSHPAYQKLRDLRQQSRNKNQALDGHTLATGLEKYSAMGDQYIRIIQSIIRQNEWVKLDHQQQSV